MAKPEKIRYSRVACLIDGIIASKVQTVGNSADTSKEKLLELTNNNVVQYIENVPNVSITIDTNDVGSMDTMRLLTGKFIRTTADSGVTKDSRYGGYYSQIKASYKNTASILPSITETELLNARVDVLCPITEDGTSVHRTVWFHWCALSGISWNYDVNGFTGENYSLRSDNKTWFLGRWGDVRAIVLRRDQIGTLGGVTGTAQTFYLDTASGSGTGIRSSEIAASSVLAMGFNENIAYRQDYTTWKFFDPTVTGVNRQKVKFTLAAKITPPFSTPFASSSIGGSFANMTRVIVLLKPATAQTWDPAVSSANPGYALKSTAGSIGGKPREYITPVFWNTKGPAGGITSTAVGTTLRLQSASIDISPGADPLFQLGSKAAFSYDVQEPLPITVTLSALDSDVELFARACATSLPASVTTAGKSLNLTSLSGANNFMVRTFKESTKVTPLKGIRLYNMSVTSNKENVTVGGNQTSEFTFECSNIVCSASGKQPY
jgi:hypothetical protein